MKRPLIIFLISILLVGCAKDSFTSKRNNSTKEFTVTDLSGLDRHETIEYFQSQEGQSCYATFGNYFKFREAQERNTNSIQQPGSSLSDSQYAIDRAFQAIERIAINSSDNMRDVSLAAHGYEPTGNAEDDMLAAMKATCTSYGYYDWKRDQDTKQYAFWGGFSKTFFKTLKTLGLGYLTADVIKTGFDNAGNTITSGGDAVSNEGGDLNYTPDNRVNNAGGTCAGQLGPNGECIVPVEMEEVLTEDPVVDETVDAAVE